MRHGFAFDGGLRLVAALLLLGACGGAPSSDGEDDGAGTEGTSSGPTTGPSDSGPVTQGTSVDDSGTSPTHSDSDSGSTDDATGDSTSDTGNPSGLPDLPEPTVEPIPGTADEVRRIDVHRNSAGLLAVSYSYPSSMYTNDVEVAVLDGTWSVSPVYLGNHSRVWLANDGDPHLLLHTRYGDIVDLTYHLYYARPEAGMFEELPFHPDSEPHPAIGDIAIDGAGIVHVVFPEFPENSEDRLVLWHGQLQGDVFGLEVIDDPGAGVDVGGDIELEVGPDDTLHVGYLHYQGNDIHQIAYASGTTSSWSTETIDTGIDFGPGGRMRFDIGPNGEPHFLARTGGVTQQAHWVHNDGSWQVDSIETDTPLWLIDISIDSENAPHVLTANSSVNSTIEYRRHDGETFEGFEVGQTKHSSSEIALEVDEDRYPHILVTQVTSLEYIHFQP